MAIICIKCTNKYGTVEFPSLKQLDEHNKGGHKLPKWMKDRKKIVEKDTGVSAKRKKSQLEPIVLRYKYKGACPKCGRGVETLKIEVGEKTVMIAYCGECKKQCKQKEVLPLKK